MEVKKIVIKTAEYLKLDDVINALTNENESETAAIDDEVQSDINDIVLAVNMINNVVSSQYFELIESKTLSVTNGIINYSAFNKNIIEIKRISDVNGNYLDYKLTSDGIKVDASKVIVEYSYFPAKVTIDDSINYYTKINIDTFAMGVASEYLFINGDIDNSYNWDQKFKSVMSGLMRPRKSIRLPKERWV